MVKRHEPSDARWALIEPLMPPQRAGGAWSDHRTVVNGMFWKLCTGAPWRDLPERYGSWKTVYSRFRRWSKEGIFAELLRRLHLRLADGTKVHLLSDSLGTPLAAPLSPGQRHESLFLEPLLESFRAGRRVRPKSLACDKGYSAGRIRAYLRKRGKRGRPPKLDAEAYRKRNAFERCFGWMKEMKALATRSEKLEETIRATVLLAMVRLCLNKIEPSDSA